MEKGANANAIPWQFEEDLVYYLLSNNAKNSSTKFERGYEIPSSTQRPRVAELYTEEGIPSLDIKGQTIIEVKHNLSFSSLSVLTNFVETRLANYNLVVVYFNSTLSEVPDIKASKNNTIKFIHISELFPKRRVVDPDKIFSKKQKRIDWKESRETIISKAQTAVKDGNNVLFLGAGVSISADLPSWEDLLKGLLGEIKQLDESSLAAFKDLGNHVLQECGNSYLIMARYLQTAIKQFDNRADFSKLIQKYLYNGKNESNLLNVLASIIQLKKVNEVITYNFDDILEQNLLKKGLVDSVDFTSISKDAEIRGHNTLPIYHVHGIIPQNGPTDTVVFSEEEYHNVYANFYHWSNVEQLHALTRMHCFFVGLSMTDPNLRRLLDIATKMNKTDDGCHFAFLRRSKQEKYCLSGIEKSCKYIHVSESLIDKKKQRDIYDLNYGVIERIFLQLGVYVIWYEEHDDLPILVGQVFGIEEYKNATDKVLIDNCRLKIEEIKDIEGKLPKFENSELTPKDFMDFVVFKEKYQENYSSLLTEVGDILNELTARIKADNYEDILRIQKTIPQYNDSFNGFAEVYDKWLKFVENCLSPKSK